MEKYKIIPKKLYIATQFADIKKELINSNLKCNDMGSFIVLNYENFDLVLNQLLNLAVYEKDSFDNLDREVMTIEKSIKKYINKFEFDYSNRLINS